MAIRHQLTDTDTVEYLAMKYLGEPSKWRDIVDYNSLVYPYISDNPDDKLITYASGYVKVSRDVATQPITIKSGWTFYTQRNIMSSATKTYRVVNDVTLNAGDTYAYVLIRSIVAGVQGNTAQGLITKLGSEFTTNGLANLYVINEQPIVNGLEGFIRTTGEYVFIPSDEDSVILQQHGTGFSYSELQYFYGADLKMELDDLVIDETAGDLELITYTDNVVQAVNRRLSSEKGDILSDFNFGNGISEIIGDTKLTMDSKKRLIKLSILDALNYEDRISDPVINSIIVDNANRACYIDLTVTVVKLGDTINFNTMKLGGTN
jgi:hypothetical protein